MMQRGTAYTCGLAFASKVVLQIIPKAMSYLACCLGDGIFQEDLVWSGDGLILTLSVDTGPKKGAQAPVVAGHLSLLNEKACFFKKTWFGLEMA